MENSQNWDCNWVLVTFKGLFEGFLLEFGEGPVCTSLLSISVQGTVLKVKNNYLSLLVISYLHRFSVSNCQDLESSQKAGLTDKFKTVALKYGGIVINWNHAGAS